MYEFTDNTHPEANARAPEAGEQSFSIMIPLEYGERVTLNLGRQGLAVLMAWGSVTIGNDNALWDEIDKIAEELASAE